MEDGIKGDIIPKRENIIRKRIQGSRFLWLRRPMPAAFEGQSPFEWLRRFRGFAVSMPAAFLGFMFLGLTGFAV